MTDSLHPLRRWRKRNNLTLKALSDLLGEPTIDVSTLSDYERAERIPKPAHMHRIRDATKVTPNQFYDFVRPQECDGSCAD